jgi:hypothetical protein
MASRTAKRGSSQEQAAKRLVALKLVKSGKLKQQEIADIYLSQLKSWDRYIKIAAQE